MKFLAAILATFISVLTVQPVIQLFAGSDANEEICCESCCSSDKSCAQDSDSQKQDANECCPDGLCNPFQVCAYCCGGIVSGPFLALVTSSVKINYNQPTKNNLVLGFRSNCYHPPEVALLPFERSNS